MIKGSRSTVVALVSYTNKKKKKRICGFQSVISTKENSKRKEKEKNIGRKKKQTQMHSSCDVSKAVKGLHH